METDLLVTTVAPAAVAQVLLVAFPGAELYPGDEVTVGVAPQQSVRARRDEGSPRETNVNVYDRSDAGGLADQVFALLTAAFPHEAVLQYDSHDEVVRANHPEIVAA